MQMDNMDEAIKQFQMALLIRPDYAQAHYISVVCCLKIA